MNIRIKDLTTKKNEVWTLEQVLNEINRDRSDNWTDYDENDWKEGWDEWVEGEFYSRINDNGLTSEDREFACDLCFKDIFGDMYELDGIQVCKKCYDKEEV